MQRSGVDSPHALLPILLLAALSYRYAYLLSTFLNVQHNGDDGESALESRLGAVLGLCWAFRAGPGGFLNTFCCGILDRVSVSESEMWN